MTQGEMIAPPANAAGEWRRYWLLPLVAGFGYSTMAIQTYAIGPFVAPLEQEFGWSRAEIMIGLTISNGIGAIMNMIVGMMVDRVGPRRVAMAGIFAKTSAVMLLATATGSILNWSILWALVGLGAMLLQAQVWSSAVASRFDHGRGFAIAVTLSGTSLAAALCPLLGTWLIAGYGWRAAFVGIGLAWLLTALPAVLVAFRGRHDDAQRAGASADAGAAPVNLPGYTLAEGMRRPAFYRLLLAGGSYAFYTMAISPNLVPIMTSLGSTAMAAASIAAVLGIVSVVARISAGWLIDRWPAHLVGAAMFMVAVAGSVTLLGGDPGFGLKIFAVVCFGATIGAEFDVVIYLVSRHFGLKAMAALMGAVLSAGALGGAIAPWVTGRIYDVTGSYDGMLWTLIVLMSVNALAMATMPRPPREFAGIGH